MDWIKEMKQETKEMITIVKAVTIFIVVFSIGLMVFSIKHDVDSCIHVIEQGLSGPGYYPLIKDCYKTKNMKEMKNVTS